jgi:putative DNA primase/helicase
MAATINPQDEAGYLTDPTGNRRFWPVRCSKINMSLINRERDQLWAEAVHRYRAGEQWWLTREESAPARQEQLQRVSIDPWQDHLQKKLINSFTYTSIDVLKELGVPIDRQGQADKIRVAKALKALGWEQAVERQGTTLNRVWKKS